MTMDRILPKVYFKNKYEWVYSLTKEKWTADGTMEAKWMAIKAALTKAAVC